MSSTYELWVRQDLVSTQVDNAFSLETLVKRAERKVASGEWEVGSWFVIERRTVTTVTFHMAATSWDNDR